jgi:hypothetical protein
MNMLTRLRERFFPPHRPLPAGIYQYTAPPDAEFPYRLHLRLEPDGRGILIANGHTVLHLNQSAAEYAYHIVRNTPPDEMSKSVSIRYGISTTEATQDFQALAEKLRTLLDMPDLDPVTYLDFNRVEPYSGAISAPYRLDCALTYRQPDEETGRAIPAERRYAPIDRVKRELIQAEWETILTKAWNAGIPHAVFTGGEPTLRPDLVDLVSFASNLGMVTGLISNGLRLAETDYLHALLQSGLDHLMIILMPEEEQSWEAIRDTLVEDISLTVHITLTPQDHLEDGLLIDRLVQMGVTSLSLSASDQELSSSLASVRQQIADRGLHLVWDLPVPYSSLHPVALELTQQQENPQGAGKAWLYVEPDGDVLRTQGDPQVLGNLLTDAWETIWK